MSSKIKDAIENAREVEVGEDASKPDKSTPAKKQVEMGYFDVEKMNEEWALVLLGSKAALVHEQPFTEVEDKLQIRTVEAFHRWYDNKFIYWSGPDGKIKPMSVSTAWMHSPKRRQYYGLEFFPNPDGAEGTPRYLNLWRGFDVEPKKNAGKYTVFNDHLLSNVCNGNEELRDWVFGWFAHMFQRPRERTATALVFRGRMGSGKSTVGEVMGSLISSHFFQVDDARYITGNFNAHMAKCLLLQAEEAVWAGDKAAEGRLKGLVSAKIQMIEAKGVDPIKVKNYVRLMMTSNEDWVVPAGKDERRFCVLDVGDNVMQNHHYFAEMHEQLDNGGREALLYDLLHFDLSKVDLWTIPKTEALLEQKLRSLDSIESWWFQHLMNGETTTGSGLWEPQVPKKEIFDDYINLSDRVGIKRRAIETEVGTKLKKIMPGIGDAKRTPNNGDQYARPVNCYLFPPLAECRAAFADAVNQPIDWPDND
jgi:hypothetical protein